MANTSHVNVVNQGSLAVANWQRDNPGRKIDLSSANLRGIDLRGAELAGADLSFADLSEAQLQGADLSKSSLSWAVLSDADLSNANLGDASLYHANLTGATLCSAQISGALLVSANFAGADLSNASLSLSNASSANFTDANLTSTTLVRTIPTEVHVQGATFSQASVYGASIWGLIGNPQAQAELNISPLGDDPITVDDLQLAQFISLLLNNPMIREVIDVVTSKVVLILGRFSETRKPVLNAIREDLRCRNLIPVLVDFEKPASKDITGTVETLARMARFIIADLTDPSSIPHELATIVPHLRTTPVLLLRQAGATGYIMSEDLQVYPWVLPVHEYLDGKALISELGTVIAPAERKLQELRSF